MRLMLQVLAAAIVAILPAPLKKAWYRRVRGYRIGAQVRLGLTLFVNVPRCEIGEQVRLGALNVFWNIREVRIGEHTRIGMFNLFRGGERVSLGSYLTILRGNVFNSIVEAETVNPAHPVLRIGDGSVVTAGHWLDFTDSITIGNCSIVGGRNSSLWTHNRQRTRPITIGEHCYLGSEVKLAPGSVIAPRCIVALGAVVMTPFAEPQCLIAGNPASIKRRLRPKDLFLVMRSTRNDLPGKLAQQEPISPGAEGPAQAIQRKPRLPALTTPPERAKT